MLSERRLSKIKLRPLVIGEMLDQLASTDHVPAKEITQFMVWTSKTFGPNEGGSKPKSAGGKKKGKKK